MARTANKPLRKVTNIYSYGSNLTVNFIIQMMKYSVILPTYNESENLPLVVSMINKAFETG